MNRRLTAVMAVLAAALHIFLGRSFIRSAAPTYDEPVHLSSGYSYLETGRYRMNIMDHPPLGEMVSAFPLLFKKVRAFTGHSYLTAGMPYHYGNLFLYRNILPAEKLLNTARIFSLIIWTLVLFACAAMWAFKLGGSSAMSWTLLFFALTPAFLSNNALVTTDAGGAVFFFAAFLFGYLAFHPSREDPTPTQGFWGGRFPGGGPIRSESQGHQVKQNISISNICFSPLFCFAAAGVLTGLALASKFNMFVLPFMLAGLAVLENVFSKRFKWPRLCVLLLVYAAAAVFVLALVYRFGQLWLYFEGLRATLSRLGEGRSSFALGRHSVSGVWWYFPLAFAVKTPVAILLLSLAGLLQLKYKFKKGFLWLIVPPALYFLMALTAKVQIGYRHILPVIPFLVLSAGLGADGIFKKGGAVRWLAPVLGLWTAVSVLRVHPYYLAYFNEFAGGPSNGYKVLTDSNLDWGQDIKTLAGYLNKEGNPPVILSYFGIADPSYYGIRYIPLMISNVIADDDFRGTGENMRKWDKFLLAVSATNIQSTYYPEKNLFDWLKAKKPVFTAGYSIFVYDITKDADSLARTAAIFDRIGMNEEAEILYQRADR
ncbi:MAG: hypothetical protein ABIG11_05570 [bacterium]